MSDKAAPIIIRPQGVTLTTRERLVVECRIQILKGFRFAKRQSNLGPFDKNIEILDVAKILWIN